MEALLSLDESLYMTINSEWHNGLLDMILIPFRHKLFWIPLYLFLLLFISMNYGKIAWVVLLGLFMTIAISDGMSSQLIKKNVKRIRPCHMEKLSPIKRVPCSHGYSFTSSHATNHFAIGTYLFLLFAFSKWRWFFLGWAGLIAYAQVYVGVHYPLDVLVGGMLGGLIGLFCYHLYDYLLANLGNRSMRLIT